MNQLNHINLSAPLFSLGDVVTASIAGEEFNPLRVIAVIQTLMTETTDKEAPCQLTIYNLIPAEAESLEGINPADIIYHVLEDKLCIGDYAESQLVPKFSPKPPTLTLVRDDYSS